MNKLITGFFMAWGNFLTLPCPYKKWNNDLKDMMLSFLPSVGAVAGMVWMLLLWILRLAAIPVPLSAFLMMLCIFGICGFMHLDGFMDCADAILSRRPLEERQRILKDSNVGAFAVAAAIFLMIGWYASMSSAYETLSYGVIFLIPVMSRTWGGMFVLNFKPIGHSQYASDYERPGRGKNRAALIIEAVIYILFVMAVGGDPMQVIVTILVETAAALIAGGCAIKQLGGMSGDIAGHIICWCEAAAVAALAVMASTASTVGIISI